MKHTTVDRIHACIRKVLPNHPNVVQVQVKDLGRVRQFDSGTHADYDVLQASLVFVIRPSALSVPGEDINNPLQTAANAIMNDFLRALSPDGAPLAAEFSVTVVPAK